MQILENSRQIPKTKEYMSNKKYCDYLYGYLQTISHWDGILGHPRYVYKNVINFSRMAQDLDKTRQTVSKKFKAMLEGDPQHDVMPLIQLNEDGTKYELVYLTGNLAMLVPDETLKVLVSALNDNAISIYVYLLNRYIANGEQEFRFTYAELKTAVGLGNKSHGNNYQVRAILFVLYKLGLLTYKEKTVETDKGLIKTQNYITWMTNDIDILPEEINEEDQKDEKRWTLYTKITGRGKTEKIS